MPSVTLAKPFRFSPNGIDIMDYPPGKHDVSDRCAQAAKEAGVLAAPVRAATKPKAPRPSSASVQSAPETAALPAAPETK